MEEEKKLRITIQAVVFMGLVAFFYDFLQSLLTAGVVGLILSTLISIWAWLHFYIWFKFKNVGFFEGRLSKIISRRLAPFILSMLVELVPALNIAPAITIGVVVTASFVYLEDKAVQKNVLSEEDLRQLQKYLSKNKRILAGRLKKEDFDLLYSYGERRFKDKAQLSPHTERVIRLVSDLSKEPDKYRSGIDI